MDIYCTRPTCPKPLNSFPDLGTGNTVKTVTQKFCLTCGMPLMLAGRYLTEKPLARGGFGAAFIARDRYTPAMRRCVVKQLLPTGLNPDQMVFAKELFDREGEVLEELGRHPQIPDLLAFFEVPIAGYKSNNQEVYFYLVQEFIDGLTLEQVIEQFGALPEVEVLRIMKSLLPVLQFVHDNNSIHRDIKPSNIMLRNADDQLFLLDFGAVKQATVAAASQKSTGIFTPGFGAPEQMRGDKVFPSTDLYAFAATCIVLLTAKQPEELFDVNANRWSWRSHTQVSAYLANILDRMLENAPSDRYASAAEVLNTLNAVGTATVIPASVPTPPSAPVAIATPTSQPPTSKPQVSAPTAPIKPQPKPLVLPPLGIQIFAAFLIGFEGALLTTVAVVIGFSQIGNIPSLILVSAIMLGVLWLRGSNVMDNKDLTALDVVTFLALVAVTFFLKSLSFPPIANIVILSAIAGMGTVAVTTLFRLIYTLIYSLF